MDLDLALCLNPDGHFLHLSLNAYPADAGMEQLTEVKSRSLHRQLAGLDLREQQQVLHHLPHPFSLLIDDLAAAAYSSGDLTVPSTIACEKP